VEQPLVHGVYLLRSRAGTGGDRLDTLALCVPQQAHRVQGEGTSAAVVSEHLADGSEVALKPLHTSGIHEGTHTQ
jgi:hypothetical protein